MDKHTVLQRIAKKAMSPFYYKDAIMLGNSIF